VTLALIGGALAAKVRHYRARYAYVGNHWPIG
jgi:hypothetical protein